MIQSSAETKNTLCHGHGSASPISDMSFPVIGRGHRSQSHGTWTERGTSTVAVAAAAGRRLTLKAGRRPRSPDVRRMARGPDGGEIELYAGLTADTGRCQTAGTGGDGVTIARHALRRHGVSAARQHNLNTPC